MTYSRNWKANLNRWQAIQLGRPIKTPRMTFDVGGELHYADVMVYPLMAESAGGAVIRMDDVTARGPVNP